MRSALQLEVGFVDHVDVDMTGLPVSLADVGVTLDIDRASLAVALPHYQPHLPEGGLEDAVTLPEYLHHPHGVLLDPVAIEIELETGGWVAPV